MELARLDPVWLITGCSSGFGRELATYVLQRGWRAVVTARDPAAIADIVAGHDARALGLALDVTERSQVDAAVRAAQARFGRIDVLVNNAGRGFLAAIEEADEAEVRALFELNYFGALAMIRAVLPCMRERGVGAIVNISSVAGLVGRAGSGCYASTKFALEGLSQALDDEVRPLGIHTMLVEPGPFRTRFAVAAGRQPTHIADYRDTVGTRAAQIVASHGTQPGDPARAAQAIVEALEADDPPRHLVLGEIALKMVRKALRTLQADLDRWEPLSRSTDFAAPSAGSEQPRDQRRGQ